MTVTPSIADLVPHAGSMCLLERVIEWDDVSVTVATATHRAPSNPLREHGRLRALHLCEYGAQAMAVHGGLRAHARGGRARPGLLVSLRDVVLHCDYVDELGGELIVAARCVHESPSAWQYDFEVRHGQIQLARGRAMVSVAAPTV
jgi:predicted hotdog family 3-hydroxylacyl-ACP dehydratase